MLSNQRLVLLHIIACEKACRDASWREVVEIFEELMTFRAAYPDKRFVRGSIEKSTGEFKREH